MAMRIGSLYVSLTAQTDGFAKSMAAAMKDVEKFSREVKKAANDAAQIAGGITALGIAALKLGADVSGPAKAAMDEFSKSAKQAAAPVAEALVPAVKEAANLVRGLGAAFAQLSPETKAAVAETFKVAAAVTAASLVLGRLASTAQLAAGVLSGVFGAAAAVGVVPLVALAAAGLGAIAVVVALETAWHNNFLRIQDITKSVVEAVGGYFGALASVVLKPVELIVNGIFGWVRLALQGVQKLANALGRSDVSMLAGAGLSALDAMGSTAGERLKSVFKVTVDLAAETGSTAAQLFADSWSRTFGPLVDSMMAPFNKAMAGAKLMVGGGGQKSSMEDRWAQWAKNQNAQAQAAQESSDRSMRANRTPDAYNLTAAERAKRRVGGMLGVMTGDPGAGLSSAGGASPEALKFARQQAAQAKRLAEEQRVAADEAASAMRSSVLSTAQSFVGALGPLGGIINNTINAAMTGGPWAALAAALAGIASETQAFAQLVNQATGGLKVLTDAIGPAMTNLLGAVGNVLAPALQAVGAAFTAITPILNVVAQVVNAVAPLLVLVGYFMQMLAPLLNMLVVVLQPVIAVLEVVMRALFEVARVVMTVIGAIATGVVAIWNGIIEAIASIVDTVIAIFTAGVVQHGGEFLRGAKAATTSFDQGLMAMTTTNYDAAMAAAKKARADQEGASAAQAAAQGMNDVAGAFTNVPSGFKVAAARFNADVGGYDPGGFTGGGGVVINGDIVISGNDTNAAIDAFFAQLDRRTFRSTGVGSASNPMRNIR